MTKIKKKKVLTDDGYMMATGGTHKMPSGMMMSNKEMKGVTKKKKK
jgi:hypothetical protein